MHKLLVDTGVEEFEVNGRGVLRFNPGDPNLYHRFFAARDELAAMDEELTRQSAALPAEEDGGASLELLAEYDRRIKALLNRVFGAPNDFDALLDGVNLAGVGTNGRRVVENLLDALTPVLQEGAQRTVQATAADAVAAADAARAARGDRA
nr:hypothetical protein [uncultured Gemmiger sp.]